MMFRQAVVAQIVLLSVSSACTCEQSFNKVVPTLQMDDQSLDFGEVAVNSTSLPRTVQLKAITASAIKVSVAIQDDPEGVFELAPAPPETVPPNGKETLSVVFKPKAVQAYAATLVVTSNDPNPARSVQRVPLTGSGESPQIEVTPDHLSFSAVACPAGAMSTRCRDEQTVTIRSTGRVNLTLGVVKVVGADASTQPPANLSLKQLVSTATILPGDTLPVALIWRPRGDANVANSQTGDFSARLEIPSDDPANPVIYVDLAAHADPAEAPHLRLSALSVVQRKYTASSSGQPTVTNVSLPSGQWVDPADAQHLQNVLPGMTVTFTTLPYTESNGVRLVDPVALQHDPWTYDPQDLPLSITWLLTSQPASSRTGVTPTSDSGVMSANGVLPIDAAGEYVVTVRVTDTLGLTATASMTLTAPVHDDLLTQLSWGDTSADLDLHLIADTGAGVPAPGTFLSSQDCYWQEPSRQWFGPAADETAVFLRDDQGTSGLLESVNLLTAPVGSRFRAVVHHFAGSTAVTPSLEVFHTGAPVTPSGASSPVIQAAAPLGLDKIWIGARIEFINCPANCETGMCCPPTITPLDQVCDFTPDVQQGRFDGTVGACTGGGSL